MESNPAEAEGSTEPATTVEEGTETDQVENNEESESKIEDNAEDLKGDAETIANAEENQKMMMDYFEKMQLMGDSKDPKSQKVMQEIQKYKTLYDKHLFWDTQPVPKGFAGEVEEGEIEKGKLDEVRQEPYALPGGFTWSNINLEDESELNEVYELLRDHYVEDSDHMFRFDYQKEFLKWALLPPKQFSDWICGVRGGKNNKLFGMITGVPVKLVIKGKMVKMTEINFL